MTQKPLHPGLVLADFMTEYGLTQAALARGLDVPRAAVSDILRQKRGISVEMAIRLGAFFGDGPEIWSNLQRQFDFDTAEARGLTARIRASIHPVEVSTACVFPA
jgi:antitoxin HigA-1